MITVRQAAAMAPEQRAMYQQQIDGLLQKNRRNMDALLSAAALHYVGGNKRACADALLKAHEVNKRDKMVLSWASIVLSDLRDHKQALALSQKLLALGPGEAQALDVRARVLEQAGRPREALEAFEKVREIAGENPELALQIANCHFYLGELDKAEKAYERLMELDPDHAMGLYGYSTVHKFTAEEADAFIGKVDAAIPANRKLPEYNVSALHYTAAKIHDDTGQLDEAFERYRKANDVRRPSDTEKLSAQFDCNKRAFHKLFFEDKAEWGDRSATPIFIVGMPRSGTTLVESIAASHPAVTAGGEMPFMDLLTLDLGIASADPVKYNAMISALTRPQVSAMARKYLQDGRVLAGTTALFTDKMPHNFMNIGLIRLMFPKARIIHCLRDPIDTCLSIYTNAMTPAHNYYKSDLATLGTYYRHYQNLMAYWHEMFPGKILDIHYEDVVANTELNSRRIIEYLGLPWRDEVLKREGSQGAVKTLSAWQVRQPIYSSAKGKWRRFEKHLGPLIEALGDAPAAYRAQLEMLEKEGAA